MWHFSARQCSGSHNKETITIIRRGLSPPCLPNLHTCDFYLCGMLKDKCTTINPTMKTIWKGNIQNAVYSISPAELQHEINLLNVTWFCELKWTPYLNTMGKKSNSSYNTVNYNAFNPNSWQAGTVKNTALHYLPSSRPVQVLSN